MLIPRGITTDSVNSIGGMIVRPIPLSVLQCGRAKTKNIHHVFTARKVITVK